MKHYIQVALLAVAAASFSSHASANTSMNIGGQIFQPLWPNEASCFYYNSPGIMQNTTCTPLQGRTVAATLPRVPNDTTMTVYVDGYDALTGSTDCTIYSYNWDGTAITSKNISHTGTNDYWEESTTFTPAEAPVWAYLNILCTITTRVTIRGVILN